MIFSAISTKLLSLDEAQSFIKTPDAGAQIFFSGTVRNTNLGKKVLSLEYSAYDEMAEKVLGQMAITAKEKFEVEKIYIVHRLGHLQLEDISILIAVSAKHRVEAYQASRFLIEEVKHHLPVWKKEHYQGEKAEWVRCSHHHQHQGHDHDRNR
ncbi:MAG: molybdenum cofactor biosynthesis protein MoaE [Bacteriovoracaceae bacterium]